MSEINNETDVDDTDVVDMIREAFEKGLTKVLNDAGLFPVPRTLRIATDYALAQAPAVAEYIEIGHWYQHEETGCVGSVDEWQVEQGFFKNNPRLVDCGKVYKLKETKS